MTPEECKDKLFELKFIAGMNQRYSQEYASKLGMYDRTIRVAVAIIAAASLITSCVSVDWIGITFGAISFCLAVLLNVMPFGENEKFWRGQLRQWTDLRSDVERAETFLADSTASARTVPVHLTHRIRECQDKKNGIDGEQPAADKKLLADCESAQRREMGIS